MGFQNTQIIGYVGKDPETRHLGNGNQVCSFSVAVSEKWKDSNGDQCDKTTWYKVAAWGAKADVCQQYVKKGMQIMVQGKVSASAWTDKEGNAQSSLELNARDFQFLGSGQSSHNEGYSGISTWQENPSVERDND